MSARSLNKVQLIGNLTRDPELRYTPQGTAVCTIGLATNRYWTTDTGEKNEDVEYHKLVAWSKLAEICSQLLKKGRKIYAEGRLQTREWATQDGQKRQTTEIVMENMIMLDPKGSDDGASFGGDGDFSSGPQDDSSQGSSAHTTSAGAKKKSAKAQDDSGTQNKSAKQEEPVVSEDISDDIPF
jgi:single-strand DNA-binding protein